MPKQNPYKKKYIKRDKKAIASSYFHVFTTLNKETDGKIFKELLSHRIERTENTVTYKAYIEYTIRTDTKTGQKQLDTLIRNQKSPLRDIFMNFEKNYHKARNKQIKDGKEPTNYYKLEDEPEETTSYNINVIES